MTIRAKEKQYEDWPDTHKCCLANERVVKGIIAKGQVLTLIGSPFPAIMECTYCGHTYHDQCMNILGGSSLPLGVVDLDEGEA